MSSIRITPGEWDILKEKLRRKYNHLSDDDLSFEEGNEEALIDRLARRVKRNRDYVVFTLKKGLADLNSNRL
jgi:hypothetical protein